jgi:hypothetical protein
MSLGPNPRTLEELRIGGGYGDPADGGADFEKNGAIATDGGLTVEGDTRLNGKIIVAADTELTIASGAVTVTQVYHTIRGEGSANDELATINGGEVGQLLLIRTATSAHTITVKAGTGNITMGGDFFMNNTADTLLLINTGTNWLEVSRSNNG